METAKMKIKEEHIKEIYCLMREADQRIMFESLGLGNSFSERFEKAVKGLEFDIGSEGYDCDHIYSEYLRGN